MSFKDFFDSYLETAAWSSTDENGEPLDAKGLDFAKTTQSYLKRDAKDFYNRHNLMWKDNTDRRAGHDFWLTRNRHGAGFWDGGYENGEALTQASRPYGEEDLYTYRGKIRASGEPRRVRRTTHSRTK